MSPELRADFEARWPELSVRLDRFLANRNVSPCVRDDLIQETAIRLFGMWSSVDRTRSPWPLTITIALNLLRDNGRSARNREVSGDLPETVAGQEVEAAGLARLELRRVATALQQLPSLQRAALMREIGVNGTSFATREAEKMLRMRARKRLRAILERVSGILILRPRRDPTDVNTALMARDGLTQVASCVACAVLGLAAGVVPGMVAPPSAEAARLPAARSFDATSAGSRAGDLEVPRLAGTSSQRQLHDAVRRGERADDQRVDASSSAAPAAAPLPQEVPIQPPAIEPPAVEPPTGDTPSLPPLPGIEPPQGDDSPTDPGGIIADLLSVGTAD